MSLKSFSRKDFLTLTLTAVGASVIGCGSDDGDDSGSGDGGSAGDDDNGGSSSGGTANGGSHSGGNGGQQSSGGNNNGGSSGSNNAGTNSGGGDNEGGTSNGGEGGETNVGGSGGNNEGGNSGSGEGGSGGEIGANQCTADSIMAMISMNHGHALTIPLADITAGVTKVYNAQGEAGHSHFVQLTEADFATLRSGEVVIKHSCNGGDHEFLLTCGITIVEPGAPQCDDNCGDSMGSFCADPA